MYPLNYDRKDLKMIESYVFSDEALSYFTRLLKRKARDYFQKAEWINKSRSFVGKDPIVLDDFPIEEEQIWMAGEMYLIFLRLDTPQLAEILSDLIASDLFSSKEVNEILHAEGLPWSYDKNGDLSFSLSDDDEDPEIEEPNINQLLSRMERGFDADDYASVLHSAASIFEVMAKLSCEGSRVNRKTFGQIVQQYRSHTPLPDYIVDYMNQIYIKRGQEPNAGHGKLGPETLDRVAALLIKEFTKTLLRTERLLKIDNPQANTSAV